MKLEEEYLYTKEHEWASFDGNTATIGISAYAQEQLGDITFIELPSMDDEVEQFGDLCNVESVKAASDIFSPMSGKIVAINEDLNAEPGIINKSPFENGWIAKVEISDEDEKNNLMTADEYRHYLESA